jgi:glycosyltransferase involved in cell wall biosynthesis
MKNLVIFSDKLLYFSHDKVKTTGSFTIQIDALTSYFQEVTLCTPTFVDDEFNGISFESNNISFSPLPYYSSRTSFIIALPRIIKQLNHNIKRSELSLIILSGYVGVVASFLCQYKKAPTFQWIISDWGKTVVARRSSRITKWLGEKFFKPFLNWLIYLLTKNVLTFYNGKIPEKHKKPYHYTRISSSIKKENLFAHEITDSIIPPITLLFVGRLSPEKGINFLVEVLKGLLSVGIDANLHIVGSGDLEKRIKFNVKELSIEHKVTFHGFIPHNNKLRRIYSNSDLLIVPSIEDQTPKVILEGMAYGIPVIATNVGAIPQIITDRENGLLVPPKQTEAIIATIRMLISDNQLRRSIIQKGFDYASEHTIEKETKKIIKIVNNFFDGGIHVNKLNNKN